MVGVAVVHSTVPEAAAHPVAALAVTPTPPPGTQTLTPKPEMPSAQPKATLAPMERQTRATLRAVGVAVQDQQVRWVA